MSATKLSLLMHQADQHRAAGRVAEARAACEKVLRRDARHPHALNLLGMMEGKDGHYLRAAQLFRRAVAAQPAFPDAIVNLGVTLLRQDRPAEALAQFDRALAAGGGHAAALQRGRALLRLHRLPEALDAYGQALKLQPGSAAAHAGRAHVLREALRLPEALDSVAETMRLQPGHPKANLTAAQCHLAMGDLAQGWPYYEARMGATLPLPGVPRWAGAEPVAGRRVLLHAEQGLGDTLMFCRYAPLVAAQGAEAVLHVQPPLLRLLRAQAGMPDTVPFGAPLAPVDLQCLLPSLPSAFGTTLDTIPARSPYLAAEAGWVAHWAGRLGPRARMRVGLAWSGNPDHVNDHNRSVPFAVLQPLLGADAEFVSLQRDVREGDRAALAASGVRHFGTELSDFADTAALASLVDVVLSVDTSVAHLAGAMGRPTWLMLPWAAEWRWLLDREDSPWYPTMRLFRQPALADWAGVVRQVRAALDALPAARDALPG